MKNLRDISSFLVPSEYRKELKENVPSDWLLLRKGAYLFAAVPFRNEFLNDYGSIQVKNVIRRIVFALPFVAPKGLFLLYYGDRALWESVKENFRVDRTSLHAVILQSVHFADFETGESFNTRTSWGPVKFGFCGRTIEKVEAYLKEKRG